MSEDDIENKGTVIDKLRKRGESFNTDVTYLGEEIFPFLERELESCNLFIKHNKIDQNLPNVLWAFKSSMITVLFRPVLSFDGEINAFNLKKIRDSEYVTGCFGVHIPLFIAFDTHRINPQEWAIYDITKKNVKILLKLVNVKKGNVPTISLIEKAAASAKIEGWDGEMFILTMSDSLEKI